MRLTKDIRNSVIRAVLADLPASVDYDQQMRDRAWAVATSLLPPLVKQVASDPKLRGYVNTETAWGVCDCMTFRVPDGNSQKVQKAIRADEEFKRIHKLRDEHKAAKDGAEQELRVALFACSTSQQFAEQFPDLAKYLPLEAEGRVVNLPATTAVMDKLRAAGLAEAA